MLHNPFCPERNPFMKFAMIVFVTLMSVAGIAQAQGMPGMRHLPTAEYLPSEQDRLVRLERMVERQQMQIQSLESRVRNIEYGTAPGPVLPPPQVNPADMCKLNFDGYYYSVRKNNAVVSGSNSSLDATLDSLNKLQAAGICANLRYYAAKCDLNFDGYYYSIKQEGRTITSSTSSQDQALGALTKLRNAGVCQ